MPQIPKYFKIVAHNFCPVQGECDTEGYAERIYAAENEILKIKNGKSVDKLQNE